MSISSTEGNSNKSSGAGASPHSPVALLKETYNQWSDHQAPRLGASVAFYSILSFAPLIILVTAIIGLVFGHEHAQGVLIDEARQVMGDRGADTVQDLLKNAQKPASGAIASAVAFLTLLFGASGVFLELQDALNLMWDVKTESSSGLMGMIKQRLFSFGMVLSIGFLLLISLLLSAGLAFLGHSFGQLVPMPPFVLEIINFVVSFVVITVLFALMFKYVPNVKVSWKDVGVGAVGTAFLFTVGKLLLGIYLGKASVGSTYGAAGSLVAVVVWIYYSAQIFFFGAEFTHVYNESHLPKKAPAQATAAASPLQQPEAAPPMALAARVGSTATSAQATPSPTPSLTQPAPTAMKATPPAPLPTPPQLAPTSPAPVPVQSIVIEAPKQPAGAVAAPKHRTKPELLTSMAIGFVLGRVSQRLQKQHEVAGD